MKIENILKYPERELKNLAWKNGLQLSKCQILRLLRELQQYQHDSPQAFTKKLNFVFWTIAHGCTEEHSVINQEEVNHDHLGVNDEEDNVHSTVNDVVIKEVDVKETPCASPEACDDN